MLDWILVYLVVFFFVFLFQYMVNFFDVPDPEKEDKAHDSGKKPNSPL
jgi:phosphotransferase system  glucose/maltose/N-acetylglucosamine-specific IIC component